MDGRSIMAATQSPSLTSVGTGQDGATATVPHQGSHGPTDGSDAERLAPSQPQAGGGPPPRPSDEDLFQPRSVRFWLTLLCNFLALFLVALDRTIIATAVPRISDEFHSLGDIGWYGSAYMLTTACAQLLFGRIYKFYPMKWAFLASIIIFEAGSAICGAAPDSTAFIVGRAIAGFGSAGIFSGCLLIMIPMIPLHRRPAFQGLFGMVFGIASVLGPLVGGGFTGGVTWRWCFYINLPIGAVALGFMIFFWNPPKEYHAPASPMEHFKRLDPLGMFFFLPGVICLFTAFQWGGSTYDWNDWRIIVLLVMFAVCTVAFIAVQILKPETASVPPRVIMQRSVAFGTGFTFFLAGSMLMLVYYVPVWFQTVKQVNPIRSGIYTLPLVLSLVFSSIASGGITQKIGYYVPSMLVAPALMSIGEGLLSTLDRDSPTAHWVAYQFLSGFGLGFGMQTSGLAIQAVLPREDISTGIAINFFVQQLGGAVFTSVGQTILTNMLVSALSGLPGFDDPKAIVNAGATKLSQSVPPQDVDLVIAAYSTACRHIFFAAMGLAFAALLCALGMEWKSIKKGRHLPPGAPPGTATTTSPPINPTTTTKEKTIATATATGPAPGRPFFDGMRKKSHSNSHSKSKSSTRRSLGGRRPKSSKDDAKRQSLTDSTARKHAVLTKPAPTAAGAARPGSRRLSSLPPDEDLDGVLAMWAKYSRAAGQTPRGEKQGGYFQQQQQQLMQQQWQRGGEEWERMERERERMELEMGRETGRVRDEKKKGGIGGWQDEKKKEVMAWQDEKKGRELVGWGEDKKERFELPGDGKQEKAGVVGEKKKKKGEGNKLALQQQDEKKTAERAEGEKKGEARTEENKDKNEERRSEGERAEVYERDVKDEKEIHGA